MNRSNPYLPNWSLAAAVLALFIALAAVLGILALPAHGDDASPWRWVDLDRELNLTTFFSAGLLLVDAWLAWLLIRGGQLGRLGLGLTGIFILMGCDELLKFHESLEKLTGIDWQILYLPIVLFAGLAWVSVWLKSGGLTRTLWTGGALAWAVSQLLEATQWGPGDEKIGSYNASMVTEDLLEMIGSGMFLLALLRLLASVQSGLGGLGGRAGAGGDSVAG